MNLRVIVSIVIVSSILIVISPTVYNYYAYTLPMKDILIDHYPIDFHYSNADGKHGTYGVVKLVTLLEDGSIDVEFGPNEFYLDFGVPNFTHTENIKVGQTFVVLCQYFYDYTDARITSSFEELLKDRDKTPQKIKVNLNKEFFKTECKDNFDRRTCEELSLMFYDSKQDNITQEVIVDTRPYLDQVFYDKPFISILKYMGLGDRDGVPVHVFVHADGFLKSRLSCNYPQIIEYSIDLIDLEIPDWFICTYTSLHPPSLVLNDVRNSDRCAVYNEAE